MGFSHKIGEFKRILLGAAFAKARNGACQFSSAIYYKWTKEKSGKGWPSLQSNGIARSRWPGFRAVRKTRCMSWQNAIFYCFFFPRIPDYRVGCYYCLFQQEKLLPETATVDSEHNTSEYVVCFLGGSEKGLELYPFFGLWWYQEGKLGKPSGGVLLPTSKELFYPLCICFISSLHTTTLSLNLQIVLFERFYISYWEIRALSWFIIYCFLKNVLSGLNWTSIFKGWKLTWTVR